MDTLPIRSLFCEICDKPVDGSEPAEYLIPNINEGKYGVPIVGHCRCTSKVVQDAPSNVVFGNLSVGHLLYCLVQNTRTNIMIEAGKARYLNALF